MKGKESAIGNQAALLRFGGLKPHRGARLEPPLWKGRNEGPQNTTRAGKQPLTQGTRLPDPLSLPVDVPLPNVAQILGIRDSYPRAAQAPGAPSVQHPARDGPGSPPLLITWPTRSFGAPRSEPSLNGPCHQLTHSPLTTVKSFQIARLPRLICRPASLLGTRKAVRRCPSGWKIGTSVRVRFRYQVLKQTFGASSFADGLTRTANDLTYGPTFMVSAGF